MANNKPHTADEYVVARLLETEESLTKAHLHIATLETDLEACKQDYAKLKKHFKVCPATSDTELKITFNYDDSNEYAYDVLAFSDGIDKSKFSDKFVLLVQLLKLEEEVDEALENIEVHKCGKVLLSKGNKDVDDTEN